MAARVGRVPLGCGEGSDKEILFLENATRSRVFESIRIQALWSIFSNGQTRLAVVETQSRWETELE